MLPIETPMGLIVGAIALTLLVQTGVDIFFTGSILPGSHLSRGWRLAAASLAGYLLVVLAFRPILPLNHTFLLTSREEGWMALGVLIAALEYFLWIIPFVLIRGWIVSSWLLGEASQEKRQAWWSYCWVGSAVTVLMLAALYVAVTLVPPLMMDVEQQLGG